MKRHSCPVGVPLLFWFALLSVVHAAPSGLVHHWNFDEGPDWHDSAFRAVCVAATAFDSVGGADATLRNMGGTNWVSGRQFTALEFDGANQFLDVGTNLAATLGGTASLSFWIRTVQTGAETSSASPGVAGALGAGGLQWGWLDDTGRIALSVGGLLAVRSAAAVNNGQWHHAVFTRDAATGHAQVYVDGKLSASGTGPAGTGPLPFSSLGRIENGAGAAYFRGRLDQVHVFSIVMDPATVQQLWDNHAPKTWDSTTVGTAPGFTTESMLFRAYDPDQDPVSLFSHGNPTHGSVVYRGDGTFSYTPAPDFTGQDAFKVTVEDGRGGFASRWMKVTVTAPPAPGAENRTTTFADFAPVQAEGTNIALNGWRCPRALDWDGDGRTDLLVGHSGTVWRYLNTGSAVAPLFGAGVRVQAAGANIALSGSVTIALADMTGDGRPDLLAVDSSRKMRIYRNSAAAGQPPLYAASVFVKNQTNTDLVLPDQRFDLGDWNGDGLPDLVTGVYSGEMRLYLNVGAAADPRFDLGPFTVLESSSYNLYPRLFDLSRNGVLDVVRGINWGSVNYWLDSPLGSGLGSRSGSLTLTDTNGASPDLHALTDGAMADFADFTGDGVYDLLLGGHAGSSLFLARGIRQTVPDSLAAIEAIYDAYPNNLGFMLETNSQALLSQVRQAENNIVSHMFASSLPERQTMFQQLSNHVKKYAFLRMAAPVDTTNYHHLPSIAGQNLLTMHQMLPDSPAHRTQVANAVGLTGTWRAIYLQSSLHVGDNQMASRGQIESVRDLMSFLPRVIFPDTMLTLDHYYGDGRGGHVNAFTSTKNTFNFGEGGDVSEDASDLNAAVLQFYGAPVNRGDYFTFVMGHEVTHSLDGYVNGRANKDLRRRWGLVLCTAAGPDIIPSANGWIDWSATRANFLAKGFWDGASTNWSFAWSNYWATGPGAAWQNRSFMRGNIDWFLQNPQESLATQANQYHAHSEARLIGALDRFRRGAEQSVEPLKANLNEVVHFLDFQSAGLNKVILYDTIGTNAPYKRAAYAITRAWLERDDLGYIRRISVGDRSYDLTVDARGVYTAVATSLLTVKNDDIWTLRDRAVQMDVLANDMRWEGGRPTLSGFTQPAHGTASSNADGTLLYTPAPGYLGLDRFDYSVGAGGTLAGTGAVTVFVADPAVDALPLVPADASWCYQQTANLDEVPWVAPGYDDSAWARGPATLGVESATLPESIRTPLTLGRTTYYFRTRFVLPPGMPLGGLHAHGLIDDGAVIYLNGVEVARIRMGATNITYSSFATNGPPPNDDVTGWEHIAMPAAPLLSGTNVLAVEVHQVSSTSSDLVFNLRLSSIPAGPQLTLGPGDLTRAPGESALFTVAALGAGPLRWQWFRNGLALPGETNAMLSLTSVGWADAAAYHVQLANDYGQTTSLPARLTVWASPGPQTLIPLNGAWRYNQTQNLDGTGWMNPGYADASWPLGNALLYVESATLPGPKNTLLTLGRTTYYFRAQFNFAPETAAGLVASNLIDDGAVIWLNGQEAARLRFTNAVPRYADFASATPLSGDATNFDVVTLPMTSIVSGTNVVAVEVHQQNSGSSDLVFGLALAALPPGPVTITADPVSLTVPYGDPAGFGVSAAGPGRLSYQWLKNGLPLPGQTNAVLEFGAVTAADAATYHVAVSNPNSAVASLPATLTVLPPPQPPVLDARLSSDGSQLTLAMDCDTVIVQSSASLGAGAAWKDIATNPPHRALTLPVADAPQQFFRLRLP